MEHSPTFRHVELILAAARTPREILLSGKPLKEIGGTNTTNGIMGWRMALIDQTLHILLQARDFDLSVEK